jgi:hypothetical protein
MIKIINVSGSMRKKPPISSKFCMVSKGKHGIFLDIWKNHEVTIPTNQESRQMDQSFLQEVVPESPSATRLESVLDST